MPKKYWVLYIGIEYEGPILVRIFPRRADAVSYAWAHPQPHRYESWEIIGVNDDEEIDFLTGGSFVEPNPGAGQ